MPSELALAPIVALAEPTAVALPTLITPAKILVPPLYVLAPDKVSVLVELVSLVTEPMPLTMPEIVVFADEE